MKKLIISCDSYSWVKYCSGMVAENPKDFIIMIVFEDDDIPIGGFVNLCKDAVYVQRHYDLSKIGRRLGIPKIMNLRCNENSIDLDKLVAQIQLTLTLERVSEVYHQDHYLLNKIFNYKDIISFKYGNSKRNKVLKRVTLSENIIQKKLRLSKLMVGKIQEEDAMFFPVVENYF